MNRKDSNLLDRCDNLSLERFKEEYLEKRKPVIISNSFKWNALKKWNLEYLRDIYPHKSVLLTVLNPRLNTLGCELKLKLPNALDLIENNNDKDKKYYLMQRSIYDEFPELASDISVPKYASNNYTHVNFWLGEKQINTKPHHDYYDNFLTQIFGKKRARLFAPSDTQYLYPYSADETMTVEGVQYPTVHVSRIADIDLMDKEEFPKIKLAMPLEGILNPGDLLYIPAGWWHEVKSLDITMSVNFWWKIKIDKFPREQLIRQIYAYFKWFGKSFHNRVRTAFDLSDFHNDLEVAEFCLSKNLKCVSCYFLLTHIDRIAGHIKGKIKSKKVFDWKKYLEISRHCDEELLDRNLIENIINEITQLQCQADCLLQTSNI